MNKLYAFVAGLLGLGLLLFYVNHLQNENAELISSNNTLKQAYDSKVSALLICSNSVKDFADKSDAKTEAAKKVVEEAKKESKVDYKNSSDTLFRKPKTPVVTPDNQVDYGSPDKVEALKDYVQTHDLFNDYLDKKAEK